MNFGPLREDLHLLDPGAALDPLVLASHRDTIAELQVKEIEYARLAMLSVFEYYVQAVAPGEGLAACRAAHIAPATLYVGQQEASVRAHEGNLDYIDSSNLVHALSFPANITCQLVLMGAFEANSTNGGPMRGALHLPHPNNTSDPVVLAGNPDTFDELKVQEIKDDRLNVLYMFGHHVQAGATDEGPDQSWGPRIALAILTHVACAHVAKTV